MALRSLTQRKARLRKAIQKHIGERYAQKSLFPLWNASAHLFFCLPPCLHSQPQQNLSHMPAFIMIISDRDSPSKPD